MHAGLLIIEQHQHVLKGFIRTDGCQDLEHLFAHLNVRIFKLVKQRAINSLNASRRHQFTQRGQSGLGNIGVIVVEGTVEPPLQGGFRHIGKDRQGCDPGVFVIRIEHRFPQLLGPFRRRAL